MTDSENNEFIRQLKKSNSAAFKQLFHEYQAGIFNFIFYKICDQQAAEDILQDVFSALWENRHSLIPEKSLKAYLYTLAKNLSLNYLRHQRVVMKYEQMQPTAPRETTEPAPDATYEKQEIHEKLLQNTQQLPEMQRIVFMMSRIDGLSNREIAERLEISIKTVETHIGRAVKKIVELMKEMI